MRTEKRVYVRTPAQRRRISAAILKSWRKRKSRARREASKERSLAPKGFSPMDFKDATPAGEVNNLVMERRARSLSDRVLHPLRWQISATLLRRRAEALRAEAEACDLLAAQMGTSTLLSIDGRGKDNGD